MSLRHGLVSEGGQPDFSGHSTASKSDSPSHVEPLADEARIEFWLNAPQEERVFDVLSNGTHDTCACLFTVLRFSMKSW